MSEWLGELPDEVLDALVAHHRSATSPRNQMLLHQIGGAVARCPRDATAFAYRDAAFEVTAAGCWEPRQERAPHVAWTRSAWEAALPGTLGGASVNHLD